MQKLKREWTVIDMSPSRALRCIDLLKEQILVDAKELEEHPQCEGSATVSLLLTIAAKLKVVP